MLRATFAVEGLDGPYQDFLHVPVSLILRQMQAPESKRKGPRGGVSEPFPTKLYEMLQGVEDENLTHIVSWLPHGRAFVINAARPFVEEIMPR
jgi:HSF-type DNA-binding